MPKATTIPTAVLGLLAALNLFAGIHHLLTQTTTHVDLHLRWVDQQYILRGRNPYDVCFAARSGDVAAYERQTGRTARPFADLGAPKDVGYPPWSFVIGALLYWPSWEPVRLWCTAVNLMALAYLAWWASRLVFDLSGAASGASVLAGPENAGSSWQPGPSRTLAPLYSPVRLAILFAAAVLACSGHVGTLRVGQGTIVVLAFLAASLQADATRRPLLSGLFLGLALMKPTVAGPFVLGLLITGRWKALASCTLYVLGASCVIWFQTGVNPAEMTLQMFRASQRFLADGTGPMNLALQLVPDPRRASAALAFTCLAVTGAAMWRLRTRPLLELFALAALCGRFWTYHRGYDDTALIFLVAALATLALKTRSPAFTIACLAVGLTLWMPGALYSDHTGPLMDSINQLRMPVWLGGAIALVACESRPELTNPNPRCSSDFCCATIQASALPAPFRGERP